MYYIVLLYVPIGFFEKDKLLLGMQMAIKLSKQKTDAEDQAMNALKDKEKKPLFGNDNEQMFDDAINMDEYNFFLRGGIVKDRKGQTPNPNPDWITEQAWDMLCEIEKKLSNFSGIVGAFVHNSKEWKRWYLSNNPESFELPGEWDVKCKNDKLKKIILVKAIRPDRVRFAAIDFVKQKLGEKFVKSEAVNLDRLIEDSKLITKNTPVIFILAPGVDPFPQLDQIAHSKEGITLYPVSLG